MRVLLLIVLLAFIVSIAEAQAKEKQPSGLDKIFRSMFQPRKPTPARPAKRKRSPKPRAATTRKSKTFTVNAAWYAKYIEMEMQWDYPIPEDALIQWKNGDIIIPLVVFKHYEDMAKTPVRAAVIPPANGAVMP